MDPERLRLCNVLQGSYKYMEDLLRLEANSAAAVPQLPPRAMVVSSPLHPDAWQRHLRGFPDPRFSEFLLRGLREGFRIGFQDHQACRKTKRNMRSAYEHPDVVQEYLDRETHLQRIFPLRSEEAQAVPRLQISAFGVIPKRGRVGKWRLIVDLSSPEGHSVNAGVTQDLCSISYTSVDEAVRLIQLSGRGTLLAKMDLKEAYRSIPVHPTDRPLLAVQWRDTVLVDGALPFGLRSAPKLFSAVADVLLWIFFKEGVQVAIHYLDDFLFLGPPGGSACAESLQCALRLCEVLGVPVASEKTEGPSTALTFLRVEIDSVAGQLRLPKDKLADLRGTLQAWMRPGRPCTPKGSGTKRDLLSLIGRLHHASRVVKPGRAFIRSLIDASMSVSPLDHHVSLNADSRADIAWWSVFVSEWNGVSLMLPPIAETTISSDASGSWGCGAVCDGRWFQLSWPMAWRGTPISPKELVPIVVALALWGPLWRGKQVQCLCDNIAVVYAVNRGSARDPKLMRLLRILAFLCAVHSIGITAKHIAGVKYTAADALSRNNLPVFFASTPQATPVPAGVPLCLQELVLNQTLRWTSPSWKRLFSTTLSTAWHLLPERPMPQPSGGTLPSALRPESPNHGQ